ncbi:ferredoxin [Mycolicibacterium sp. CBMA 226]|uniref:ferredoxin n=1 Tax=Mycolicibacterium sp. CBMA 226 TaxID=2606611 RepID=UPI0012DF3045|nr:ferredoxin [Mycolicibacterium sp. CBMA 226]MUL78694.1 ferredoxin [Mycolicibacterium sp. CBMA 226]
MKLSVDPTRCASIGLCESLLPEIFQIDDDGVLTLAREDIADDEQAQVQTAVDNCPTGALRLQEC